MKRFQFIKDLIDKILRSKDNSPRWQPTVLPQVETPGGFVVLEDLSFTSQNLTHSSSRQLDSNRRRLLRVGGATQPKSKVKTAGGREPFSREEKGSPLESAITHCPQCIERALDSRTFVGPVLWLDLPREPFLDDNKRYHNHDPNLYRLTYLCSNGHQWERGRYKRCWCGWSANPEKAS